jgi:hypothetical protein
LCVTWIWDRTGNDNDFVLGALGVGEELIICNGGRHIGCHRWVECLHVLPNHRLFIYRVVRDFKAAEHVMVRVPAGHLDLPTPPEVSKRGLGEKNGVGFANDRDNPG